MVFRGLSPRPPVSKKETTWQKRMAGGQLFNLWQPGREKLGQERPLPCQTRSDTLQPGPAPSSTLISELLGELILSCI